MKVLKRILKWITGVILVLLLLAFIAVFIAYWKSTNDCGRTASPTNPMKAIVYCDYGLANLKLQDIEKPTPTDDQLLVRVRAVSVNPYDWHFVEGTPYVMRAMGVGLRKPKDIQLGADFACVCSTRNVDLVKSLGADHVIDYTKEDFTKGAERYDVMLDNVGNHSLSECRAVLTPNGKYVLIGGGGADEQGFLGGLGKALWAMVFSKFVNQQMGMMMADANGKDLTILADMMESGKLKPVIDRTYKSLAEIPDAIRYLEEGHARGKVVITVE